jgi:hypothetical protein
MTAPTGPEDRTRGRTSVGRGGQDLNELSLGVTLSVADNLTLYLFSGKHVWDKHHLLAYSIKKTLAC